MEFSAPTPSLRFMNWAQQLLSGSNHHDLSCRRIQAESLTLWLGIRRPKPRPNKKKKKKKKKLRVAGEAEAQQATRGSAFLRH
jgi:hypothetical protein